MKEQGACALWALAGTSKAQQRIIAEKIGIPALIEMLLLSSEKLQYVGKNLNTTFIRDENFPLFSRFLLFTWSIWSFL